LNQEELIEEATRFLGEFSLSDHGSSAGSVAAALLTRSGKVYTGICIDLPSGMGFCAEHSAIAEMLKNRETDIELIVAVGEHGILPPCGRCREMMYQINKGNLRTNVIVGPNKIVQLDTLLPFSG
jgi:cytidine deaminase